MDSPPRVLELDREACHRAMLARDARFDGRFYVCVRTTGIFCRPICPARPKLENVTFCATAAEAHAAGFRPCLRCRPESSPGTAAWRGTSTTVSRALAMIERGALDEPGASVDALAQRLGMGERQLRRLFDEHVGVSPGSVARTRRFLFAKKLLHETSLGMTEIAMAAGYGSLRRFNDAFLEAYGRAPSTLRRERASGAAPRPLELLLGYVEPYDWDAMLTFFAARTVEGVERVERVGGGAYERVIAIDGAHGTLRVEHAPAKRALAVTIGFADVKALPGIVRRVRRVFDLDADATEIARQLSRDPALAPLVEARPGLRVPGAWCGFELAVRAVLGQQVSVAAARRLAGELVARLGERVAAPAATGLERAFPTAAAIAEADLSFLRMPGARARTLGSVARAALAAPRLFERHEYASLDEAVAALVRIPGVGEWTAQYIALRALHDPDAFPAADAGLMRAACEAGAERPSAKELARRAEAWRPWRAYAAQLLWTKEVTS